MTHICYIFLYSYRLLKNIGVSFDPHYLFSMEGDTLHIEKTDVLPEGYFGRSVYSVTSIVGNNGAGKTSALRFLMEAVVDGYHAHGINGIVVYEKDGQLCIYQPNKDDAPLVSIDSKLPYSPINSPLSIPGRYYAGHFCPKYDKNDILSSELAGAYIASDQWLLIHDLLNYSNFDSFALSGRFYSYLFAHEAQNNARICELLLIDDIGGLLKDLRLPRYIIIEPNDGGAEYIANSSNVHIKIPRFIKLTKETKQNAIAKLIYTNIINLIAENQSDSAVFLNLLERWQSEPREGSILDIFNSFINQESISGNAKVSLQGIHYVLKELVSICSFDDNSGVFYVEVEKGKHQLRELIEEVFNSHFYLTSKFFDIYYSHGLYTNTILSSGEQELLNLLSRLYFSITQQPKQIANKQSPSLLLLDEAEIGYHPEWQRKYVNLLLQFLNNTNYVSPSDQFQIVITSHSPIILSDLPLCCVNILQKNNNGDTVVREGEAETFGENVFNLYRRAFVMTDGLIGSFAKQKLESLVQRIECMNQSEDKAKEREALIKEIKLVGDIRIRELLISKLSQNDVMDEISYHEARIKELTKRIRNE